MLPYIFTDKKAAHSSKFDMLMPMKSYISMDKNTALKSNPKDLAFRLRPPRFSVSAISVFNLSHFAVQSQPFCAVKWAILHDKMADFETQGPSR